MDRFPIIGSKIYHTPGGTPFLKAAGVVTLAVPQINRVGLSDFLDGFDPELEFGQYVNDPDALSPLEELTKIAGQLCYMSFGKGRTKNENANGYLANIKSSGHGSVMEHGNVSFLLYGESRSVTHELVRHRAGTGFSQVSQRYVSGKVLRFVERPEFQNDDWLHQRFLKKADMWASDYEEMAQYLIAKQKLGDPMLSAESKTDLRKRVQESARSELPNCTEAPIVMSANIRSWRHILEMRASSHAESEVRRLAFSIFLCLKDIAPLLFEDYTIKELPDGSSAIETPYRKV